MRHENPHRFVGPMCCLGFLLLLAGCRTMPSVEMLYNAPPLEIRQPHRLQALPPAVATAVESGKPVPISLDTVLRLAQDQNG